MIDANTPPPAQIDGKVDANARSVASQLPADSPLGMGMWTSEQARRVVIADYNRAAAWRATNIEPQWQESSDTYMSETGGAKYWRGTKTPRANLKARQAFQQVNALRPQVLDALTGSDIDFDVETDYPGVTFEQTHGVRTLVTAALRECGKRVRFQSLRSVLDTLIESALVFNNGCLEFGWDGPREEIVPKWQQSAELMAQPHPLLPQLTVYQPTGNTVTHQAPQRRVISRFFVENVDQTDFYIDPDTRGTNVQLANYCLRRRMMTVREVAELRGQDGFDIPDDIVLYALSRMKTFTEGDTTRQYVQSNGGVDSAENIGGETSKDPMLAKIEVLRYWQKDRHVWILGRKHVAWNGPNALGVLPFFNWAYINKPGAFYGFSIPELLRTDQKVIKELMDGRLDEINLILHPPTLSKKGTFRSQTASTMYPGSNWEVDDPSKDIQRLDMPNVTQNASEEINAAENRGQKVTGVTDLAVLGTPSSGGNSANRTATGVQAQTSASNSRVHGLVANIEDTVIQWMLYEAWDLTQQYMSPQDVMQRTGVQIETAISVLNTDVRFTMKTANNMRMRAALQNGGLQQINQYMMNPEMLTLMSEQQGLVPDVLEWAELTFDAFHVKPRQLFRPMTPQEQQAKQARDAQQANDKMALQGARLANMERQAHDRDETNIITALIGALVPALAQAGLGQKLLGLETPIELEGRKLDAEIAGGNTGAPALQLAQDAQQSQGDSQ